MELVEYLLYAPCTSQLSVSSLLSLSQVNARILIFFRIAHVQYTLT
jgi:hypothetical protein